MDKEVLGHFSSIADQLIKEFGAKEAIQRAMAIISGNTKKIHARSLITGTENMVTFLFKKPRSEITLMGLELSQENR